MHFLHGCKTIAVGWEGLGYKATISMLCVQHLHNTLQVNIAICSGASSSVLSNHIRKNVPESDFVHFLNFNKGCSYSN